ncbi:MAG: pantoate--beta-alanine ligase, partial [Acidimicrobiia bacterium]
MATPEEARIMRSGRSGLVPTMGFLHEGHLSLVEEARRRCDTVVMSLFVNPLQFDRPEDLETYPRHPERDAALAEESGVDVLFAPPVEVMYPQPPLTTVSVSVLSEHMEGAFRPGHFDGVATVVTKLFASLRPDVAFFGRKDHQQLILIERMAADLSMPVEIVGCQIIREPDGLALSSRNVLLGDRPAALSISRGLFAAADAVEAGARSAVELEA